MPEKYRRNFMKDKEVKAFLRQVSEKLKINIEQIFGTKAKIERVETKFADIFLVNGKPLLVIAGENLFPTLVFNDLIETSPKVVVNMGAVPHVCNGANVMAPGITRFEGEFREGFFVLVVDEKHGKPIAIGEIIYDMDAAKKATHGIVVRNVHFVGDKIWNFIKKLEVKA